MLVNLNNYFFGPVLPFVLLASGIFLLIRCRFFILRYPHRILTSLFSNKNKRKKAFRAACVALAGTLGVGNIAGVAAAIAMGGAGAIFWMWIFAFFAMVIKYAEVVVSMATKTNGKGGTAYAIEKLLGSRGLGCVFSLLLLLSSFGIGNIVQSAAASEALSTSFGVGKHWVGVLFCVLTLLIVLGGIERITAFSSTVIPLLSLGYVLLSLAIIVVNRQQLPSVWQSIFRNAFAEGAVWGGGSGFLIGRALRYGASRGILSNEAGCGTAAYAHATGESAPVEQGFWGIFEVFVDTILLCTMTALVVLLAFPGGISGANGMEIAINAYHLAGVGGGVFIAVSSAVYALASVICWSYYGMEALKYLVDSKKSRRLYLVLYSAAGILGACFSPSIVWEISDLCVSLMALFSTICLCLCSKRAAQMTNAYFRPVSARSGNQARQEMPFETLRAKR